MNAALRTLILLAMSAAGAASQGINDCKSGMTIDDLSSAIGSEVRIQPVFSGGGLKGWRLYHTETSAQLVAHSISNGALITHVCGVPAREIFDKGGTICCDADPWREFEVTFRIGGQEKKVRISSSTRPRIP